jgi:hypothetical protein
MKMKGKAEKPCKMQIMKEIRYYTGTADTVSPPEYSLQAE